jgi:hypothetical protein
MKDPSRILSYMFKIVEALQRISEPWRRDTPHGTHVPEIDSIFTFFTLFTNLVRNGVIFPSFSGLTDSLALKYPNKKERNGYLHLLWPSNASVRMPYAMCDMAYCFDQ